MTIIPNENYKSIDYDKDIFDQQVDLCEDIEAEHVDRISDAEEMEKIYLMDWDEKTSPAKKIKGAKTTIYPGPRNRIMGYIRLLAATDPEFIVPKNILQPNAVKNADMIEKSAKHFWQMAGRVKGDPIHLNILRSAAIYGEIQTAIYLTKDRTESLENSNASPAALERARRIERMTPIMYKSINPRFGFPLWDDYGLYRYHTNLSMKASEWINQYGDQARYALGETFKMNDVYSGRDIWDLDYHIVSIDNCEAPIVFIEHNMRFIPVACTLVEGSDLFTDPEDQRNPFLYTYYKSGLWNRANLALTVMYSNLFLVGSNAQYLFKQGMPDQKFSMDTTIPGGTIVIPPGSDWKPIVSMGAIDPQMQEMFRLAVQLEEESTIYSQTLGEPLGKNSAYAMVALLAHTGRLPLVLAQKKASDHIGDLQRMSFLLMKDNSVKFEYDSLGAELEVTPDMIPEHFEILAKLDISAPQDSLQDANVAIMLRKAGLASEEWIQENILHIGQPGDMRFKILAEQSFRMHFENYVKRMMRHEEMREEMEKRMMDIITAKAAGIANPNAMQGMGGEGMNLAGGMPTPTSAQFGGGARMPTPPVPSQIPGENALTPQGMALQGIPNEMAAGGGRLLPEQEETLQGGYP